MYSPKNIFEDAVNSRDHVTLVAAVKASGMVDTLSSGGMNDVTERSSPLRKPVCSKAQPASPPVELRKNVPGAFTVSDMRASVGRAWRHVSKQEAIIARLTEQGHENMAMVARSVLLTMYVHLATEKHLLARMEAELKATPVCRQEI